jgi:polysaccharide biosynthesis protein PslH
MNVLFLSRWSPYPADNGSKIRIFNIIRVLAGRHDLSLLAFTDSPGGAITDQVEGIRRYCSHVQLVPYQAFRPGELRAIAGFFSPQPRSVVATQSQQMRSAIEDELRRRRPDVVLASQLDMLAYAIGLRGVPAVLDELEVSLFRDAVQHARTFHQRVRTTLTWFKLAAYLRRTLPHFRACTVVSELEQANVEAIVPDYPNVVVLPNAVDVASYRGDFGAVRPASLVFSGALTYRPNADAVQYLLSDIYPVIQQAQPDALLRITGDTGRLDLDTLRRIGGVQFTGHVKDVRPVVASSSVSVVPLRLGGGTRLKILEAMALGTPVVSTSKGAEGLEVTDGEDILLADDPHEFAQRVLYLLSSPQARARIAAGGRRLVKERYDWAKVGERLCGIVEAAGARSSRGK